MPRKRKGMAPISQADEAAKQNSPFKLIPKKDEAANFF